MDKALIPTDFMHFHVFKGLISLARMPHHLLAMARDSECKNDGRIVIILNESRTYERYGHRHFASFAKHQVW
jgi:hypothetical protein